MRGMLEPMFGEWGALIVQFVVTAAIVLALVAIAYWLVRRYSLGGLGRVGRGRVPRLSIVDAMPVDGRRRLVLVRRDNVEHLILIGGPSDVVVEGAIQRPRRPKPEAPEAGMPVEPASAPVSQAAPAAVDNSPIPFPQARAQPTPPASPLTEFQRPPPAAATASGSAYGGNGAAPPERTFSFRRPASAAAIAPAVPPPPRAIPAAESPPAIPNPPSPARYIDMQRPTRIESPSLVAPALQPAGEPEPPFPELPTADLADPAEAAAINGSGAPHARMETDSRPLPKEPSPFAKPRAVDDDTAAKVSDLEREMARLLGEITQGRN